eukprot:Platyproteum_vivax@DN386_c0_g1_i2.p1
MGPLINGKQRQPEDLNLEAKLDSLPSDEKKKLNNDKWNFLEELGPKTTQGLAPVILVQNKIDKVEHMRWLKTRYQEFCRYGKFQNSFYISALTGRGVQALQEYLEGLGKPGQWEYPADTVTNLSKVQQVEQIISTYLFVWFNSKLPYDVQQQTIGWTRRLDGVLLIEQELIVEDSIKARILCGVRNRILIQLRKNASYQLERLWGERVQLLIHVKGLKQVTSRLDPKRPGNEDDLLPVGK